MFLFGRVTTCSLTISRYGNSVQAVSDTFRELCLVMSEADPCRSQFMARAPDEFPFWSLTFGMREERRGEERRGEGEERRGDLGEERRGEEVRCPFWSLTFGEVRGGGGEGREVGWGRERERKRELKDKRGLTIQIGDEAFFVTTFAQCYPSSHPRYSYGQQSLFILMQPEISFSSFPLSSPFFLLLLYFRCLFPCFPFIFCFSFLFIFSDIPQISFSVHEIPVRGPPGKILNYIHIHIHFYSLLLSSSLPFSFPIMFCYLIFILGTPRWNIREAFKAVGQPYEHNEPPHMPGISSIYLSLSPSPLSPLSLSCILRVIRSLPPSPLDSSPSVSPPLLLLLPPLYPFPPLSLSIYLLFFFSSFFSLPFFFLPSSCVVVREAHWHQHWQPAERPCYTRWRRG